MIAEEIRDRLRDGADKFGTPQYFLMEARLLARIENVRTAFESFSSKVEAYYPYKANDLPYLCKVIHESGVYAEVSSFLELKLALKLEAGKIILNGPGKSDKAIQLALNHDNVLIIADSLTEIKRIKEKNEQVPLGLRLNLGSAKGSKWDRFGIKPEKIRKNIQILQGIELKGVQFHVGSEIRDPKIYARNIAKAANLIRSLPNRLTGEIEFLDIGGGFFPGGYRKYSLLKLAENLSNKRIPFSSTFETDFQRGRMSMKHFSDVIEKAFEEHIQTIDRLGNTKLIIEPGRLLVNNSFHMLTSVVDRKGNGIVLDSNTNLIPHLIYEQHPIFNLTKPDPSVKKEKMYGNLCAARDWIGEQYRGKKAEIGDVICIKNIGAYSISESPQFIKPKAKVIAWTGKSLKEVRKEEDFPRRYINDSTL